MQYKVKIIETRQCEVTVDSMDKRTALVDAAEKYLRDNFEMDLQEHYRLSTKLIGVDGNTNMLDLGTLKEGAR